MNSRNCRSTYIHTHKQARIQISIVLKDRCLYYLVITDLLTFDHMSMLVCTHQLQQWAYGSPKIHIYINVYLFNELQERSDVLVRLLRSVTPVLLLKHGEFRRRLLQSCQFPAQLVALVCHFLILLQRFQSVRIRGQRDHFISNLCRQFVNHVIHHGHRRVVNETTVANLVSKYFYFCYQNSVK